MSEGTQDRAAEAAKLVRHHMFGSVAAGLFPVPLLDAAILAGVQLRMISKLASLYDVDFSEQRAEAIIGSLAGVSLTVAAGGLLWSLLPGLGKVALGVSALTLPAASTYAIGHVFIEHFDSGGTFLTFDEARAKTDYDKKLAEGKQEVEQSYAGIKP